MPTPSAFQLFLGLLLSMGFSEESQTHVSKYCSLKNSSNKQVRTEVRSELPLVCSGCTPPYFLAVCQGIIAVSKGICES